MSFRRSQAWLDRRDKLTVVFLLLLSGLFSALRWGKMISLWGDSPRLLLETYRVFSGDIPYRDVASFYPPLAAYIFAGFYKVFGQTFTSAEILMDFLSTGVVISTFLLARQFLPGLVSAAIAICLASSGVSAGSAFALYSLNMYSPSALVGAISLNLFLIGLTAMLGSDVLGSNVSGRHAVRWPGLGLATLGANLAILTRTELLVPILACLSFTGLCLWISRRRPGQEFAYAAQLLAVGLLMFSPAGLAYAWLIAKGGLGAVITGLLAYGSAGLACPYWPTGIGLLGFSAGLGEAALVYICGALLLGRVAGSQKLQFMWASIVAALVVEAYLYAAWDDFPRFWVTPGLRSHASLRQGLGGFLTLGHLMVPVMSASVGLSLALVWRLIRDVFTHRTLVGIVTPETILCLAGAGLCVRSPFGSLWTELPLVNPTAYPALFVIAGLFLGKAFALPSAAGASLRFTIGKAMPSAAFFAYGIARLGLLFGSAAHYDPLETAAGRILVDDPVSIAVYRYVETQTGADDSLADISYYGGGLNFSARRRDPLFMTAFAFCAPPEQILRRDADRIVTARPALVIGNTDDHLGTMYGGGTLNACTFPHLVWRSGRISGDPARVLPVVSVVRENYTPVFRSGNIEVLKRNDLLTSKIMVE